MEGQKTENREAKRGGMSPLALIAAAVLIIAAATVYIYNIATDRIIDMNISQIEELARHDRKNIENSLNKHWNNLSGLVAQMRVRKPESLSEISEFLAEGKVLLNCRELMLVDAKGNVYHNSGIVDRDSVILEQCAAHDGDFVARHVRSQTIAIAEESAETLVIASRLGNVTINGVEYTYLIEKVRITELQSDLKISSFGDRGISSVIDREGYYIVDVARQYEYISNNNFITDFADASFKNGMTAEEMLEELNGNKSEIIATEIEHNGERSIISMTPLDSVDWVFICSVPRSVFEEQSAEIIKQYGILLTIVVGALLAVSGYILNDQRKHAVEKERQRVELAEAYKLAQQASTAKTTFLNSMSHDIRTPMNAIIGYTTLATSRINEPDILKGYLAKITQSSHHLLSLINDVLDMSRIESGKVQINEGPENLSEFLHNLNDFFQGDVEAKHMHLTVRGENVSHEDVMCDRLRLNQVLINLVSNAVKYTPEGGDIAVTLTETGSGGGYADYRFSVKDNGIGMSEEFQKTVFEAFTREETSTVSGIQGTGLGLAITKNLVELMEGRIGCRSKEGQGSEFTVELRFKVQETHESVVIAQYEGQRALVADDDSEAGASAVFALEQVGMNADLCASGQEAVDMARRAVEEGRPYSFYVIERVLPDMEGMAAARAIKEMAGDHAVVTMCGYDWSGMEYDGKEAGLAAFISKPVFASDIRKAVGRINGENTVEATAEKTGVDFSGKRVLLVEDNELNQEIAIEILSEAGLEVETADNGRIACDILLEKGAGYYDLVLMDVQMPVMDGYEATRNIRSFEDKELAGITVIAMTANAFAEDREKARNAGMDGHVAKPIDVAVLFETLSEIFNK